MTDQKFSPEAGQLRHLALRFGMPWSRALGMTEGELEAFIVESGEHAIGMAALGMKPPLSTISMAPRIKRGEPHSYTGPSRQTRDKREAKNA